MALVGEGLHDTDAAHRLFEAHVEVPDTAVNVLPGPGHPSAIDHDQPDAQRHDGGCHQRQRRMQCQHEREGTKEGHHGDEQILGAVMGDLSYLFQVAGHARHQLAGAGMVEPAPTEPGQMREGARAQFRLDLDPQHVTPIDHDAHQRCVHGIDRQQHQCRRDRQAPVAHGQQPVDEPCDRQRKGQFQQA